jgi:hypothetical protein
VVILAVEVVEEERKKDLNKAILTYVVQKKA